MIERLLAAEEALARDELELAGRLFSQVAKADERNAIAVVGLARIAEREGRLDEAQTLVNRALEIDPDEAAGQRLLRELLTVAPAFSSTIPEGYEPSGAPPVAVGPGYPLADEQEEETREPEWPSAGADFEVQRPSLLARLRGRIAAMLGRRPRY